MSDDMAFDTHSPRFLSCQFFPAFHIRTLLQNILTLYCSIPLSLSHDVKFSCFLERELLRLDGLVRVLFLPGFPTELPNDMTFLALTPQNILICHKSFEANRPPCVDPSRADPDLGAEAIAKAVREARTRVYEHASRVNAAHESGPG